MAARRHIVSGTDFSDCAEQALELAIELAAAGAARVTLVHVCEPSADVEVDHRRLARCSEALAGLVSRHRHHHAEMVGILRHGKPWAKLDNVAAEVGASLIVVGRQGTGRSAELGSVAERLVRSASRPVLIVARDFDRPEPGARQIQPVCTKEKKS